MSNPPVNNSFFSETFNSVKTKFNDICAKGQIHSNIFQNVPKAGVYGAAVTFVFTQDLNHSAKEGVFFAMATLIHGLTTPLFKICFKKYNLYVEMGRGTTALAGATFVATKWMNKPMSLNAFICQVAFYFFRLKMSPGEMFLPYNSNIMGYDLTR